LVKEELVIMGRLSDSRQEAAALAAVLAAVLAAAESAI
jgi:hypothetical protein